MKLVSKDKLKVVLGRPVVQIQTDIDHSPGYINIIYSAFTFCYIELNKYTKS